MDSKSLAIKTAQAHQSVIDAADIIAAHFGFTEQMDAIRAVVFSIKQPHLVQMKQAESVAALLHKVAEHLQSIEPESVDADDSATPHAPKFVSKRK